MDLFRLSLEKERSERLKLEKHLSPRKLSEKDKRVLVTLLSPHRGQKCNVCSVVGDDETNLYARELEVTLRDAGWETGGGISQALYSTPIFGVQVEAFWDKTTSMPEVLTATRAILMALAAIGVKPDLSASSDGERGSITLIVGSKGPLTI